MAWPRMSFQWSLEVQLETGHDRRDEVAYLIDEKTKLEELSWGIKEPDEHHLEPSPSWKSLGALAIIVLT